MYVHTYECTFICMHIVCTYICIYKFILVNRIIKPDLFELFFEKSSKITARILAV